MKRFGTFLFALLLQILYAAVAAQTQTALITRLQASAVNDIIDIVKDSTLPKMIANLNARGNIRDGKLTVGGFGLDTANLDVSIGVTDTKSTQRANVRINVKNVRLSVRTLNYKVADNFFFSCTLRYRGTATFSRMFMDLKIDLPPGQAPDIRVSLGGVDLSSVDVDLDATGGGLCGLGLSSFLAILVDAFDGKVDNIIEDAIRDEFSSHTFLLTDLDTFNIEKDDEPVALIAPKVKVDRLYSTDTSITLGVTTSFRSTLIGPEWRSGMSYQPKVSSSIATPPEKDIDSQILLTFDSINALLASVWYAGWAIVADEPASVTSTLCESSASDPCLFPPYVKRIGFSVFAWDYWLLTKAFLFSSGLMKDFTIEAVVDPPSLDFQDGQFSGLGQGRFLVSGTTLFGNTKTLTNYEVGVVMETDAPTFNQANGSLQNFRIRNVDIFADKSRRLFWDLFSVFGFGDDGAFGWAARALGDVMDKLLPIVNAEIEGFLARTKLELPPAEDFPVDDQTTNVLLSKTRVNGLERTSKSASFLEVASDVSIVINNDRREL